MKTKTKFFVLVILPALFLVSCISKTEQAKTIPDDQPRRIELLFLGHDAEHHPSRTYMPILAPALTKDGINITYTEDVNDLNADNLAQFDGVILYANYEDRMPEHEQALMDYVSEGHAFIPLHCASFCFKDSDAYIDMVGGRFTSHETGIFTADIVDEQHPIMKEATTFETWDETYVHDKLAEDITILMERVEGEHREPYTWVKNYGKGKVFYTAFGHDERTWQNKGFQNLVKQGILWAVDTVAKKNWTDFITDMPTLAYEPKDNIPNYEKRDPPPQYQLPLSPEASSKLIQVPPGFKLELFASEPDIVNPIAMNWDEHGRLWAIETVDYPNTVREDKSSGDDLIKIMEDTDKDGKADKVTVFAEGLNLPTSFVFVNGGILVSQAPHFLFLKDTDGDDKADIREVIIDGWGTFDTHAGPSNLQLGIDNNIYGVLGYSGFKGEIFGKPFEFGQGLYRFDTDYTEFEYLTKTSNNTWGLGFTEDNSIFASTANNTHSVYLGINNSYFEGVEGISNAGSKKIDGHYFMQPITPNVRQVDVFGGFTAAAGHHFYTAREYPKSYWNKVAFVCEPTGGLVHISKIVEDGAGYVEQDGGNLFSSADEWVSPVEAKVGPDGVVWVADWYNFIVQHNPTPRKERGGYDAENGEGNAYKNPLRDKSKGRIWRVVPKTYEASDYPELSTDAPSTLIATLGHDNMFWRLTAQRLLVERNNEDVVEDLLPLVADQKTDAANLNSTALHAIWALEGLVLLEDNAEALNTVEKALSHPSAAVRKAALQILPKTDRTARVISKAELLNDKDPKVVLQALLVLSELEPSESMGNNLFAMSETGRIMDDNWLSKAVYIAGSKHSTGFIAAYKKAHPDVREDIAQEVPPYEVSFEDGRWKTMTLPQTIEDAGVDIDGALWFRKTVSLPQSAAGKSAILSLAQINDNDITYVNGQQVGATKGYQETRTYNIKPGILKAGENTIAVWMEDVGGGGGIYGDVHPMELKVAGQSHSLEGDWKYDVEKDYSGQTSEFSKKSIAELMYENYGGKLVSEDALVEADVDQVIIIRTIKNEMKYDIPEFTVKAGETIELVFENNDFMQHNLLVLAKGSKELVGAAADKMAQDPNGAELDYIPDMPQVLEATPMVDPEKKAVLRFTVPDEPGEYPYICTFPGHWRIMQGVMKVVPNSA